MKQATFPGIIKNALSLLCVAMLFSLVAFAQENTGSVQGSVKDSTGATVPGAKVILSGSGLVRELAATTDSGGEYLFPKVPAGTYTVTVSQTNFKTVKNEEVKVVLGYASKVDVALTAGNISEAVTITAGGDTIDVSSSKAATNITTEFIDKSPKGRNFHSLLVVAPGVRAEPKAGNAGVGGFSVNGASGSENTFVIDGVEVTNVRNGSLGRQDSIPFEFLREVQVKTAGFEAEYGGTLGGVINVVSKGGSDEYHGEGWLQFTNAGLNSRGRGFWQRTAADPKVAEFFRSKEDEYRVFYPGFTFGGPIIKQRLNFFTGYSGEAGRTERTIPFLVGTKTTTQRVVRHYGVARVDYAPTQKIQINTSYFWNPVKTIGLLTGTDPRVAPPTSDFSTQGGYTPASNYTASVVYTPTSKLILEARYGYKYLNDKGNTYGKPSAPLYVFNTPSTGIAGVPTQWQQAGSFQNVSSTFLVLKDITTRNNVYLNASYITHLFGQQHSLKGGYALNRLSNDVNDDYINGRFNFNWGEGFTRGSIVNAKGTYGYYTYQDGVRHNAQVSSRNQGYFIQDGWHIRKNITINAGVRFENEFLPPYVKEVAGKKVPNPISFGWGDKIAPLIGGAWDIRGDGKWKFRASYGQYFDLMKYELARGSFGGDYWHDHVYPLNDPDIGKLSKANPAVLAGSGKEIIDIDNRTIPINAQGQLDGIDPDIKPMSSRQYAVALEHEFRPGLIASVAYTRSRLVRGIEDIGVLDANESEVYTIGNPGFGQTDADKFKAPNGQPYTPRAVRNYDGVEFRVDGRFSEGLLKRLNYNLSYTYSRLWGNWAGLANSDENGRSDPNVSRAFDLNFGNFDGKGKNVFGLLATDRPHTFKMFLNYEQPWGKGGTTLISLNQLAYSGTPLSSEVTVIVPVFYNGRGDLGRTPALTQTDMLLAHTINLSERMKMKFDINVINLFNQAAVINKITRLNRNGSIPLSGFSYNGFDATKLVNPIAGASPALNVIYGRPSSYQGIREVRIGMRLMF